MEYMSSPRLKITQKMILAGVDQRVRFQCIFPFFRLCMCSTLYNTMKGQYILIQFTHMQYSTQSKAENLQIFTLAVFVVCFCWASIGCSIYKSLQTNALALLWAKWVSSVVATEIKSDRPKLPLFAFISKCLTPFLRITNAFRPVVCAVGGGVVINPPFKCELAYYCCRHNMTIKIKDDDSTLWVSSM